MIVRQEVFDTYWYFAYQRQEIFFKRLLGEPQPWTTDKIMLNYKFCNVYRACDRVSQYLIKNVIYSNKSYSSDDTLFRIILFKIFNKIETWEFLESELGDIHLSTYDFPTFSRLLEEMLATGNPIYTNAYMSCASKAYGYDKKHQNHLKLIEYMFFSDHIIHKITSSNSFRELYEIFKSYPLLGGFMAYQLATDINYSEVTNYNEHSFCKAGPGAERGIKKCFKDTGGKSNEYVIEWMYDNQENEFKRLGLDFKTLWGRPLQYIDCQGLFCETDKYSRAAFPELKSNRKRIKAHFKPNKIDIDFFFPPKWGINEKVAETLQDKQKTRGVITQMELKL